MRNWCKEKSGNRRKKYLGNYCYESDDVWSENIKQADSRLWLVMEIKIKLMEIMATVFQCQRDDKLDFHRWFSRSRRRSLAKLSLSGRFSKVSEKIYRVFLGFHQFFPRSRARSRVSLITDITRQSMKAPVISMRGLSNMLSEVPITFKNTGFVWLMWGKDHLL